ncbi:MAG: hypothetical protein JWQ27_2847 [Ferruginibacter sp.]|nr:hypothetical protein [Ferruginibacter sp.]
MKLLFLIIGISCGSQQLFAQSLAKIPDSVRAKMDNFNNVTPKAPTVDVTDEAWIKARLVKLAMENPELIAADANIRIAEIARQKTNSNLLSSVNVGANINEFVVKNSPAASFFPKYNVGVSIPLDLFAKNKAAKQTADELITVNQANKDLQVKQIKMEVLIRYENYKEKKELVTLQKQGMEEDLGAYERAQKDYADEAITVEEMGRFYKIYVEQKSKLVTREREYNVAVIELEDMIGMPLSKALQAPTK